MSDNVKFKKKPWPRLRTDSFGQTSCKLDIFSRDIFFQLHYINMAVISCRKNIK